jgi:hypothetical protein
MSTAVTFVPAKLHVDVVTNTTRMLLLPCSDAALCSCRSNEALHTTDYELYLLLLLL